MNMRIKYIDYTRALCMLWIVGFWHLGGVSDFQYSNKVTLLFTKGILATFVYLSGHLSAGKRIYSSGDLRRFYLRRFLKIYPLYFISVTIFYIWHLFNSDLWYITSLRQYIMSILGIACVFPPAPGTVWFIDMMFLFWGITPIIIVRNNYFSKLFFSVFIYIGFLLLVFAGGDDRLLLYLPAYVTGLLLTECKKDKDKKWNQRIWLIGVSIGFVLLCVIYTKAVSKVGIYFAELFGSGTVIFIMIMIGKGIEKISNSWFSKLLIWMSYISMSAYLFHSQIYEFLSNILGRFSLTEAYLVALPITLIVSWIIQTVYDKVFFCFDRRNHIAVN